MSVLPLMSSPRNLFYWLRSVCCISPPNDHTYANKMRFLTSNSNLVLSSFFFCFSSRFSISLYLSRTNNKINLNNMATKLLEFILMGQFVYLKYHSSRGIKIYLMSVLKNLIWSSVNPKLTQLFKRVLNSAHLASNRLIHPINLISNYTIPHLLIVAGEAQIKSSTSKMIFMSFFSFRASPEARQSFLLSSNTLFISSIHSASTGPSIMIHLRLSYLSDRSIKFLNNFGITPALNSFVLSS